MRKKNSLYIRFLKFFYGVEEMDEYRLTQCERMGNKCFIFLWFWEAILFLIALFFPANQSLIAFNFILWGSSLLGIVITMVYILIFSMKLGIMVKEVDSSDYPANKKRIRKKTVKNSLIYGIILLLFQSLGQKVREGAVQFGLREVVFLLVATVTFYLFMYYMNMRLLKKYEDS
ncbi:DUF3278 domain-containing protein [Aerococcus urinae]|uniref:DUF3278 domain-containing protein n=1 Tax=Aerococcus urinae TaxID=1376 RepID=UPI00254BBF99|nr:DUF3278 domain-containing protein [Aerococcus urinae]MDK8135747.1 DUF3278 domain-containing protein [Aerococcus urinae]